MLEPVPRWTAPDDRLSYEPCERWVRGVKSGITVVDSRRALLVWEPRLPVPFYAFPMADVLPGVLSPAADPPGNRAGARFYDLTVGGTVTPGAAWTYPGQVFAGTVCFAWKEWTGRGIDHWYEEDEEIFVHPRDPFSRVDAIRSSRHVRVAIGGKPVAETTRPVLVFETHLPVRFYLPPADVDMDLLSPTDHHTRCPYKGVASYWSFRGEPPAENVAWSYPEPLAEVQAIAGHIAFYNERVDLVVDGVAWPPK